jgi:hypothetical protein
LARSFLRSSTRSSPSAVSASPLGDPRLATGARAQLEIEDEESCACSPAFTVWDTALATVSLAESGIRSQDRPLRRAAQWLGKEVRTVGTGSSAILKGARRLVFRVRQRALPDTDVASEVHGLPRRSAFPRTPKRSAG